MWADSDEPKTCPAAIEELIGQQKEFVYERETFPSDIDCSQFKVVDDNYDTKDTSIVFDHEQDEFDGTAAPTEGKGRKCHIAVGCLDEVDPKIAGYDLLLALEKESRAIDSKLLSLHKNDESLPTSLQSTFSESCKDSEFEITDYSADESAGSVSTVVSIKDSEIEFITNGSNSVQCPDSEIESSVTASENSVDELDTADENSPVSEPNALVPVEHSVHHLKQAKAVYYGEGVWMVYPNNAVQVSAMFTGLYSADA